MADRWVVNASPLILLGKAGILHLLGSLCDELVIPAGVVAEVQQGRIADLGRSWLAAEGAQFIRPAPPLHRALDRWNGGAGEAEVISWALAHPGFVAVLDDQAARRLASQHGVGVIGSLRVIVKAKERGLIPAARPVLEKLGRPGRGQVAESDIAASLRDLTFSATALAFRYAANELAVPSEALRAGRMTALLR